ncbi:rod shape-determining protein RodA [Gluconacetobacter entanii]|uniref:Peptidoglycan glycosyltransferase MrdB n=1 Tax=Gluconacetobacter entanii TaxID=108528 RepID=A0ABT3K8N5_9PROT|nr:rod shape-determining protein RodA [Gluconacetobacter entanii]MBE7620280.1 rod shape-determining protein RodA [Komagataeibacter sp. FXV2]MBY4641500.1 rod shape-determining protein RodA [Gluconacetobacter entanii]MCW4581268.1 rod shape-determining protein RodA [Gluconacetobacter entanii]MCW4584593.1 rod shape-determining protein RodA [Gluconacetobacter entanii]MCW4588007.1 rod shape-determining protein RodA [Gluconacetobacter entanii]
MNFQKRLLRAEPNFQILAKLWQINWIYVVLICLLAAVGYGALYSAGGGTSRPFAEPQTIRFCFGLVMMLGVALMSPTVLVRLAWPLYGLSLLLLVAVLRMGHVGKGAERWLMIGGLQVQPSELAKIALVLVLASWFHKVSYRDMGNPLYLIPPALMVLVPVGLVLKEPNLGTAVIIATVGASLFFAAGMRLWQIALLAAPLPFLTKIAYNHLHDYQKARVITFLHPENDPLGAGYNIIQSKIALGSGGMWGQGYLHGTQGQLNFLPEKQTDFIFTMIAEEWGYVGGAAVIGLLLVMILGGMLIAIRSRNQFGRLLGLGISMNFFLYCAVNLSMVMGAIPVGGVPLPLISYGGSAMLMVMFGFGLLLSAWVHRNSTFGETTDKDA